MNSKADEGQRNYCYRRVKTKVGFDEEFNILILSHRILDYWSPSSFDDFLGSIEEHRPESVIIYSANIHGESVIFILEPCTKKI